ncbi:MAG: outer membrane protein TolC [Bradymonadia bacterium]|jgi:outer membrane protein TolC
MNRVRSLLRAPLIVVVLVVLVAALPWRTSIAHAQSVGLPELEGAESLTEAEVLERLLVQSPDVRRARLALREAAVDVPAALGVLDPLVGAELQLQRVAVPVDQGLGSGLSVNERYGLTGTYSQLFSPGTRLSASLSSAVTRSQFPFRSSLSSVTILQLLSQGLTPDQILAELSRQSESQNTELIIDGPNFESVISLQLTQPFMRGFGERVTLQRRNIAALILDVREREIVQVASTQALQSLTVYSELRYALAEYEVQTRSLERGQRQLVAAQAEVLAGQIAPIDVDLVRQQIAANVEAALAAHGAVVRRSRELHQLLGDGTDAGLIAASDALPSVRATEFAPQFCEQLAALHPDVLVAQLQVALARAQQPETADALRPQLDGSVAVSSTGLDENYGTSWGDALRFRGTAITAGLSFSTPLGNRAARGADERAGLAVERAEFEVAHLGITLCFQVREVTDSLVLLAARESVALDRVRLAERALVAEEERFARGLSTVQLGLDALQRLEEVEVGLLRVRTDGQIAQHRLDHLRGRLAARLQDLVVTP